MNERAAFPEASFALLAELEPTSFWFRSRNELIAWAVAGHFPQARRLLDVGCGTGFVLQGLRKRLPDLELTGVEPSEEGLAIARARVPDVELVRGDGRELPFVAEFDVVGAFDVLEHVDDDDAVVASMARAARPGGGLVVTVPQHRWLWSRADDFSRHRRRYSRRGLVDRLETAGLHVVRATSFVSLLLPVLAAVRLADRRRPGSYDPRAEFSLPRPVDRAFEQTMRAERALIRLGVSFPAGASLLAIARRR